MQQKKKRGGRYKTKTEQTTQKINKTTDLKKVAVIGSNNWNHKQQQKTTTTNKQIQQRQRETGTILHYTPRPKHR